VTIAAPPNINLYERGGMISSTIVLLPAEAAVRLFNELRTALASPDSIALASWPREVCNFLVSPHTQTRGREQILSIHLDSGPQPYSKWELRGHAALKALWFIFAVIGVVSSIRWLLNAVGS
jgi:hypothetical protein